MASSILHSRIQPTRGVTAIVCVAMVSSCVSFSAPALAQEQEQPEQLPQPPQQQEQQQPQQQPSLPIQTPTYSFTVPSDEPLSRASFSNESTSERPWSFWRTSRQVLLDPTTYAPAIVSYTSTKLDWDTSQVFFRNGYVERNPRFTASGLPNDTPLSYSRGNRMILTDTLQNLGGSMANNFLERTFEQMMIERFPEHPKLAKTLGWIERTAFASYWSYRLSANHFRQWKANERQAAELGLH